MRNWIFFIFVGLIYFFAFFDKGFIDFSFYFIYTTLSIFAFWFIILQKKRLLVDKGIILFLLLYAVVIFSFFYSVNKFITFVGSVIVSSSIFLYLIFLLLDEVEKKKFLLFLFCTALVLSFYGICQTIFVTGDFVRSKGLARAHSIFVTPNTFAGFLGSVLFIYLFDLIKKRELCVSKLIGCILIILALFSTFSRTAMISLFFSFIVCFLVLKKEIKNIFTLNKKSKSFLLVAIFVILGVALIYFFKDPLYFKKRIVYVFFPFAAPSLVARLLYWKSSIPLIDIFFPFGSGFYTFSTIYPWSKNAVFKGIMHFYAHNDIIQFFVELGIFGGIWILLFWVIGFYMSFRKKIFMMPFFTFIFIFSMFEYVFYLPVFLFLFVYVFSTHIGFKRIIVKGALKYFLVGVILVVSFLNLNFIFNLYMAENYIKKAKLIVSKKSLKKEDWVNVLVLSKKSEKLIPMNVAYKMNSLRIMIVLFNDYGLKGYEPLIVKKINDILPLVENDKRSLKDLCFYLKKIKNKGSLLLKEYDKILKLYESKNFRYSKKIKESIFTNLLDDLILSNLVFR